MSEFKLHAYQEGIPLNKKGLYWSMGLGKTFASLVFFTKKAPDKSLLIVCPCKLKDQWLEEIEKACSLGILNKNTKYYVCNIEQLKKSIEQKEDSLTNRIKDFFVIVDESHLIFKNIKAQRTRWFLKNVSKYIGDNILLLSGTIIKKDEADLYAQHLIANNYFHDALNQPIKTLSNFIKEFMLTKEIKLHNGRKFSTIVGLNPCKAELLYKQVYDFWDFKEKKTSFKYEEILIEPDNKFKEMQESIRNGILAINNQEYPLNEVVQSLAKFDQVADGFIYTDKSNYEVVNILKLNALNSLLNRIKEKATLNKENIKVLIFSKFIASRRLINQGVSCEKFLFENNTFTIKEFQASTSPLSVLISSQKLMATGFNLQDANHVIFYSNEGDYSSKAQAIGRVLRQGQAKEVYIYDLVINSAEKKDLLKKAIAFSQDSNSSDQRALKRLLAKEEKLTSLKEYFITTNN